MIWLDQWWKWEVENGRVEVRRGIGAINLMKKEIKSHELNFNCHTCICSDEAMGKHSSLSKFVFFLN